MECRKVVITRLRNTEYYRGEPLNHIVDSIYQLLVNYIETSDKGYPVKNPNIDLQNCSMPTREKNRNTIRDYQRIEDADTLKNTADVPFRFLPCMASGLAYYLAIKRSPERVQLLKSVYEEEFQRAAAEDEDRVGLNLTPDIKYLRV